MIIMKTLVRDNNISDTSHCIQEISDSYGMSNVSSYSVLSTFYEEQQFHLFVRKYILYIFIFF